MRAAPETVAAIAEAIEAHRQGALTALDASARLLEDARARLRFAVGDTGEIAASLTSFSASARSGINALDAMLLLAADLGRLVTPPAPVPSGVDRDRRLEALRTGLVDTADLARHDLDALGSILRNDEAGTTDDVLRLAASIRANHDKLQNELSEALEVGACAGSA